MHRRGGKRIRMDDPPPEYVNPMTPATPMTDYGGQSVHEPETPSYSGFNVGAVANSTATEMAREEAEESHHEEEGARSPSPAPTKRITRSRGRGGDGGYVGRLAESPPPPPLRRRGRGGRGRGRGRGAAPPPAYSPPPVLLPGDDENSLYNILRFNKTAINQVVDMWIEEYKSNRESALVQLMQFFINSSGCRGKVTPDMAQMDHTLIIKKMTQEFDEESGEYPLIMSGQTWKKFRSNFCEFIQTLVKMCQYSIIYDQYLMDNIISLLTGLSDSQVRAFRHTATLAVMKLMTALVDVALLTSVNCDNCLRQYEAERLKARDKRASERLEVLVAKRQELEENMEEIKNMLSYMFKSVFVHRYRDTLPDIRAITMAEIGIWMEKFPAHFLDDLYLKYIGWTLHDKVGEVRLRCLQALQPLYECEELKGKLELFTSKFKDRIVSMSLDKETEVAVHAVKLVIAILKMHPDVLTDKDCENVYELVYSSWRSVAAAAGEFLNVRLFRADEPPAPAAGAAPPPAASPPRSRRGKRRLPNTPLIRDLVQFFIESELHEHGAYLVDSLIESNPMMKDWECMTDLLLEEAGPGEEALDNRQESSLIELMVCCVRQASTGEPPVGRGPARKHHLALSRDQAKQVSDDRTRMTAHFIVTLPALLDKFGADPEKLTNLVSIPQYFDLELYTTQRQEGNLTLLLNKLRDIVSVQTEAEVVETCGRTLEWLCGEQGGVYTRCNVARATITDMCVNRYKEAIDEYRSLLEGGETPDADEVFAVENSLRKVSIMYMCHNLNDTNIWDSLFEDLPKCAKENESQMPPQALVYVVRACFYSLLWSLHELEERLARAGGGGGEQAAAAAAAAAAALRERLLGYLAQCRRLVQHAATAALREEAYTSLCDLLVVFADRLHALHHPAEPAVRRLVLEPEPALCDLLNGFVQQFVFVHHDYDERRIEELHKRRNFLAAYCKLIVYNIAPIRRAADVFKHYIKCYNDYGDIIKSTLSKAREINKLNCALTMELAMQALFTDMLQRHQTPTRQLPEFLELKELAKRFSVMFGLDAVKNREALTALHRAGIAFAALELQPHQPPPHLLFLEPLAEFSNKLLRQDKRQVLKFLDSRIQPSVHWGEEWAPLTAYRNSLLTDSPDERPPPARKHYARRTRGHNEEEEGEENADSDQEQPGRRWSRRSSRLAAGGGDSGDTTPRRPRKSLKRTAESGSDSGDHRRSLRKRTRIAAQQ
ncbi:cohesin subunit SA-2 isoform X2 [Galleria mellonella]|uniref:Cohesin subunit SA-2 isoform X2 n=1 Tax=Galleria mellonella TaxID=7137 RepID=A0ABM3MTA5_GALME|nr:cohesin subunit SA-2 isoform X2 [Galleria mellonella]